MLIAMALIAGAEEPPPPEALWAGEQITSTVRHVPFLGDVESRTTVRTLARVVAQDGGFLVTDRVCTIDIENSGRLDLSFDPLAVREIPAAVTLWLPAEDGGFAAGPWTSGWGEADVEGDGRPGLAVDVRAPICSGTLDIASTTESRGRAWEADGALRGDVSIALRRRMLGASNACLGLVPKRNEEAPTGTFAFVPVPEGSTCDAFPEGWPARAR